MTLLTAHHFPNGEGQGNAFKLCAISQVGPVHSLRPGDGNDWSSGKITYRFLQGDPSALFDSYTLHERLSRVHADHEQPLIFRIVYFTPLGIQDTLSSDAELENTTSLFAIIDREN